MYAKGMDALALLHLCTLHTCVQLPKRLARRLMDLQYLPHIVVMNPHIR